MVEPTIVFEANEGSEGTPTWTAAGTLKWTGPDGVGDPFPAPVGDADNVFFDNTTSPDDGELWNDDASAVQVTVAGRNTNQNVLRLRETIGTSGTADPPELTAYDDATDAANRTDPTLWALTGTTGTSNISVIRAIETTGAAPGAGWTGQTHAAAPSAGSALDGNKSGEKEVCSSALAASGSKTFNLAAANPHDATAGTSTFVYCFQYTYT